MDVAITIAIEVLGEIMKLMAARGVTVGGLSGPQLTPYVDAIKFLYEKSEDIFDALVRGDTKYDTWTADDFRRYLTPPTWDQL